MKCLICGSSGTVYDNRCPICGSIHTNKETCLYSSPPKKSSLQNSIKETILSFKIILAYAFDIFILFLVTKPDISYLNFSVDLGNINPLSFIAMISVQSYLLFTNQSTIGSTIFGLTIRDEKLNYPSRYQLFIKMHIVPVTILLLPYIGPTLLLLTVATTLFCNGRGIHTQYAQTRYISRKSLKTR